MQEEQPTLNLLIDGNLSLVLLN